VFAAHVGGDVPLTAVEGIAVDDVVITVGVLCSRENTSHIVSGAIYDVIMAEVMTRGYGGRETAGRRLKNSL